MAKNNRNVISGKFASPAKTAGAVAVQPRREPTKITVVIRRQTAEEEHRFTAATDALLAELVRRQLGRRSN